MAFVPSSEVVLAEELVDRVSAVLAPLPVVATWTKAGGDETEAIEGGEGAAGWKKLLSKPGNIVRLVLIWQELGVPAELQREVAKALTLVLTGALEPVRDATFISYAHEDEAVAREVARRFEAIGDVFIDRHVAVGNVWPRQLLSELARASRIAIVWSHRSAASPWVLGEANFARGLQQLRSGGAPFTNNEAPRIVLELLDDAPLPGWLGTVQGRRRSGDVDPFIAFSMLGMLVLLPLFASRGRPLWPATLLLVVSAVLVVLQFASSQRIHWLRRSFEKAAHWLRRANVWHVLGLSERILDRIYGTRLFSSRALIASAIASMIWASPALCAIVLVGTWKSGKVIFPGHTVTYGELAGALAAVFLIVALLDFASLFATRGIIHLIQKRPFVGALAFGLIADLVVAIILIASPLRGLALSDESSRWPDAVRVVVQEANSSLGWIEASLKNTYYFFTGELHLANLFKVLFPTLFVCVGTLLVSSIFPSLVHLSLLVAAGWMHVTSGAGARFSSQLLGSIASSRRPPVAFGVVFLSLALVPWAMWPERPTVMPTWELAAAGPHCVMKTEVTQALWRAIVEQEAQSARRMGLDPEPSVFRGADRPVESIRWCEALRFCNLLSLHTNKQPAYCTGKGCANIEVLSEAALSLDHCETSAAFRRVSSDGYMLTPSEVYSSRLPKRFKPQQWLNAGWMAHNSGFRTHRVGTFPGSSEPFFDLVGNVGEWVTEASHSGELRPVHDGGAWFNEGGFRAKKVTGGELQRAIVRRPATLLERSGQIGFRVALSERGGPCPQDGHP